MDKVLIAHGGWHQSDGQPVNGRDTLMEVPEGLTICIYNAQGTPLTVTKGLVLLNHILRNDMPTLHIGQNVFGGIAVEYKEFKHGTSSSHISDYSISGDARGFTGLYNVGNATPIVPMDENFHSFLSDIIRNHVVFGQKEVRLHLLCCQCFD